MSCPTDIEEKQAITFTASVAGGPEGASWTYNWSVSAGTISSGQGTSSITVDTTSLGGQSVTATVSIGGADPSCTGTTASCTTSVKPGAQPARKFDEYGNIRFNDEKARLDNYAIQLQNEPGSTGTISSGQGTSSITVDTNGLAGQSVTATVSIGGADPSCTGTTASCTTGVKPPPPQSTKFDEYGNIRFNDEKARLDNYAIQLQNQPGAGGTIIVYGTCAGEGQQRGDRAKDYLVNTRGIEAGRITVVDGGCSSELKVQLWIVPSGAAAPQVDTTGAISPCPECKRGRGRKPGRRGDEE